MIRPLYVVLLVALLLTLPAFASSPEHAIGGTVPSAAPRERYSPSVASNGEDFFAVWSDERSGVDAVIGTRITRDGRILDPLGLRIATAKLNIGIPSVAWDGTAYLVTWVGSDDYDDSSIRVARVAPDGQIVTPPYAVDGYGWIESSRAVASNGTVSAIVYKVHPLSSQLSVVILDEQGSFLGRVLIDGPNPRNGATIAAGASGFAVTWTEWQPNGREPASIGAIALDWTGKPLAPPRTLGGGSAPSIASDGTNFVVTWTESDGLTSGPLVSRTFAADLSAGETQVLFDRWWGPAAVSWTGDRYEVVGLRFKTSGTSELVSISLSREGVPQGPPRGRGVVATPGGELSLAAATNGVETLAVRSLVDVPDFGRHLIVSHSFANDGGSGEPALLSWSGNAQGAPAMASSPSGFFATWVEQDGVFGTRIDRGGNSLDGRGIRLSEDTNGFARAAFDGTNYVVAWRHQGYVRLRWIAPLTGATVARAGWPVQGSPEIALAPAAEATLVVSAGYDGVRIVRIPHATHVPDPAPLVVTSEYQVADHPAAAWNGSELLVTWTALYSHPRASPPFYIPNAVRGVRVSASLALLDPEPLPIAETEMLNHPSMGPPSVASDGGDWLVVMSSSEADEHDQWVLARRVSRSGIVEGSTPEKLFRGRDPAVAWTGTRYDLAWKAGDPSAHERPLFAATIPRSGTPVALNRTLVAQDAADSRHTILSAGGNEAAVAYTKFSPLHGRAERSFFRVLDFNPRGRVIRR